MNSRTKKILYYMSRGILIIIAVGLSAWFLNSSFRTASSENEKETILIQTIASGLNELHYRPVKIDDEFSKKLYKTYLERLDSRKIFFNKKDMDQLKPFEYQLDDEAKSGTFEMFNKSMELWDAAYKKTQSYYKEFLAQPFDYNKKETIETDGDKLDFAKNDTELKEYWRKLIKFETLDRLADKLEKQEKKDSAFIGKTYAQLDSASRAETLKAYEDWYKRMGKLKRFDRLSDYLNCYTGIFDPHTNYFEPIEKQSFDIDMAGRLIGIGARLQTDAEKTTISEIIPGGPADKQGELKDGDIILKVAQGEGEPLEIAGMTGNEVVSKIRGKKGTEVRLTVKKKLDGSVKVIPIVRDEVIIDDGFAKSFIIKDDRYPDQKFGLIRLPKFYADFEEGRRSCADDVATEIEKLKKENVNGIILDIRNNGGGSLRDVVKMSGLFIEQGPIVQVKSRDRKPEVMQDVDSRVQYSGPLAVMVNTASASASEILAAALQDYGRAVIVGGKSTYGKGTVQRFFSLDQALSGYNDIKPLGDVKVTIQKFYRVNGGSTQLKGVVPDIILPDIYSYSKSGEKEMEFAMEWSEIPAVNHTQNVFVPDIPKLKAASENRVKNSETFKRLDSNAKRIQDRKEDTQYPLTLKEFRERDARLLEESEKFKNLYSEIPTLKIANLPGEQTGEKDDTAKALRNKDQIKNLKKDPYLEETLAIMKDMTVLIAKK